jgi:hypothetical protein
MRATSAWIRRNSDQRGELDRVLSLYSLHQTVGLTDGESDDLRRLVSVPPSTSASVPDLVLCIRAAECLGAADAIRLIASVLVGIQDASGAWGDVAVTASVVAALARALRDYPSTADTEDSLARLTGPALARAVAYLQTATRIGGISGRIESRDGKTSTLVKAIHAWMEFDQLLDLPVYEAADILAANRATAQQGQAVLESLTANKQLRLELAASRVEVGEMRKAADSGYRARMAFRATTLAAIVAAYGLIAVLISAGSMPSSPLAAIIDRTVIQAWPVHAAAAAVLAAYLGLPWRNWFGR